MPQRLVVAVLLLFHATYLFGENECVRDFNAPEILVNDGVGLLGDIDGDGLTDVVSYNFAGQPHVYLNRRPFFRSVPPRFTMRSLDQPYALYDQNGDGRLDLIGAGFDGLGVQFGNKQNSFDDYVAAGGSAGHDRALADFDGDGMLDIAGSDSREVRIYTGSADGTFHFTGPVAADFKPFPYDVDAGDFDGDGHMDLLRVHHTGLDLIMSFQFGDGALNFTNITRYEVGVNLTAKGTAIDVDGDGASEFVVFNGSTLLLVHFAGREFRVERTEWDLPVKSYEPIGLADLDGDGYRDILLGSSFDGTAILRGKEGGGYEPVRSLSFGSPSGVLIDMNGDGFLDFVGKGSARNATAMIRGGSSLQTPETWTFDFWPMTVAIADINSDTLADAVITGSNGTIRILYGDGHGGFASAWQHVRGATQAESSYYRNATVIDLDGDLKMDLAITQLPEPGTIYFGNGEAFEMTAGAAPAVGRFLGAARYHGRNALLARTGNLLQMVTAGSDRTISITPLFTLGDLDVAHVVNLDADDDSEILIGLGSEYRLVVMNQDDSTWSGKDLSHQIRLEWQDDVVSADLDGNGIQDLVIAQDYMLWAIHFAADGSFTETVSHGHSASTDSNLVLTDFDRDGLLDVVRSGFPDGFSTDEPASTVVFRGQRDRTFVLHSIAPGPGGATEGKVAALDVDNDGWTDIVHLEHVGLQVLRNVCTLRRLAAVMEPALPRPGERVTLNAQWLGGFRPWKLLVRQNGIIVHERNPGTNDDWTVTWTSEPLAEGRYVFSVEAGIGEIVDVKTFEVTVAPAPGRRRSVRR